MKCNCDCQTETVHVPDPCNVNTCTTANEIRLYTLKCGTWSYSGQMSINSAPIRGMRILWEGKAYTIEQATLVGSETCIDKWEVMLIQAGPAYNIPGSNCTPCGNTPPTQPPLPPTGGVYIEDPCGGTTYTYPTINYPNTPLPVEMGLGCGPHYQCVGTPH